MPPKRLHKTTADYLAIAVSPALIMALVGSLAYFLLEVFYQGQFSERLNWITTCFVFAIVLIGRISMTEGSTYASMYMLALAAATGLAFMALVQNSFWALVVTTVIWFCAHHLTWNCTLVDDDQDATGEGLLEAGGLTAGDERSSTGDPTDAKSGSSRSALADNKQDAPKRKEARQPKSLGAKIAKWWRRYDSAKAPPGLWVVFFSLAALPIFGLGQLLIPAGDLGRRRYVFALVFVYVAAALGLLLSTAFLALRRYMRQRRLEMPLEMAGVWLAVGGAMIAAIMFAALLIPRPSAEYAVSSLGGSLESADRDASWFSFLKSGGVEDEDRNANTQVVENDSQSTADATTRDGRQGGGKGDGPAAGQSGGESQTPGDSESSGKSQSGEPSSSTGSEGDNAADNISSSPSGEKGEQAGGQTPEGESGNVSETTGNQDAVNSPQGGAASDSSHPTSGANDKSRDASASAEAQQASEDDPTDDSSDAPLQPSDQASPPQSFEPPTPPTASGLLSSLQSGLLPLLKLFLYVAAALVGGYLLVRHWRAFVAWLGALRRAFADLLASFFGGRRRDAADGEAPETAKPRPRPFAEYRNPFLTGEAGRATANELVRYTFAALEAWAYEHGQPRRDDETPLEFTARLAQESSLGDEVRDVARAYARAAYDNKPLGDDCRPLLARFWKRMQSAAAAPQPIG